VLRCATCAWSRTTAASNGRGISFDIRAGEIVGIAGVAGNGQSELLEAIGGMREGAKITGEVT
jgi:ABC-type uncharacterized transport system ATPase subunit